MMVKLSKNVKEMVDKIDDRQKIALFYELATYFVENMEPEDDDMEQLIDDIANVVNDINNL